MEGLQKALDAVKENIGRYEKRGLSKVSIFIGIFNIAMVGYILGAKPAAYVDILAVKFVFFLTCSTVLKY